jgi:hypothetical protein
VDNGFVLAVTYQSGPRHSDLRTVLIVGKPKIQMAVRKGGLCAASLTVTLAEGRRSAKPFWDDVLGMDSDDYTFVIPAELVRGVRSI